MGDKKSELEGLPTKALECLVELLDYKSRKTCRLVSKTLKRFVDRTGLSVKIDTRWPRSTRVAQSVKVTEVAISYVETLDWSKKYLENWKTVILSGYINAAWFTNGLQRNCTNLRVLIIHEKCMTSQDFALPAKSLPIFDHLTQLQIFLREPNFIQSVGKNRAGIPIPGLSTLSINIDKFMDKSWKKIDSRIRKNMIYLLQTIRSRVLKVLHISAFTVNPHPNKKLKICWEHEPLFEFLQSHHATLEEVHVPDLHFGETEFEETVSKIPSKLQTLTLAMPTILTYWRHILLNQDSLQNVMLHVGLESRPVTIFYFILLNSVVSNNVETLVCIRLAFSNPVRLNMKMFQVCQSLEYFAIEAMAEVEILNLNQFPLKSLTTLELVKKTSIPSYFNLLQFLKDCRRPRYLRFMGLADDSPFKGPKYMLKFMRLVLRCRMKKLFIDDEGAEYVMESGATNLNYLETVAGISMMPSREQPFNFPRKAESYVIYKNQKTEARKIEAHYRSYHEREVNVDCICISIEEMKTPD